MVGPTWSFERGGERLGKSRQAPGTADFLRRAADGGHAEGPGDLLLAVLCSVVCELSLDGLPCFE